MPVSNDAQLRSAIADGIVPVSPAALIVIWHALAPTGQCLVQDHSSVPPAHSSDLPTSHANVIESSRPAEAHCMLHTAWGHGRAGCGCTMLRCAPSLTRVSCVACCIVCLDA